MDPVRTWIWADREVDSGKAHPKVGDWLGPTVGRSRQRSRHAGKVWEWPPRSLLNQASTLQLLVLQESNLSTGLRLDHTEKNGNFSVEGRRQRKHALSQG